MKKKKQIVLVSLSVGVLLMLVKFTAFFLTNSNAILTDAAESIVNVIASSFAFFSIYFASLPKDENHPYGHGKVEFFSAFLEGVLIIIAGIIIISKTTYNVFYPEPIKELLQGAFLIGITGIVNGVLSWYMVKEGKKMNSLTIVADGKHLGTDAVSSFGLIIGLVLIYLTNLSWIDSLISFALGFYIIYNGYKLTRISIGGLMDESDIEFVKNLLKHFNTYRRDEWIDVHNLRVQKYGETYHIDCHVTLPYYFDLVKVHQEVSDIDKAMNSGDYKAELFVHADPCLPECCHYCNMKECPVRKEPQTINIEWHIGNVTKNKKHFDKD